MVCAANSGHATSGASLCELLAVLFFDPSGMCYDPKDPKNFNSDVFLLSKGHAAPVLYAAWTMAGLIDPKDLLTLRKIDSNLEGHPTPRMPFVEIASGSLG
jgi:transketolase